MNEEKLIRLDRMRFIKNKTSASLTYLAILLDVIYFVAVYQTNNNYFYKILIGVSIVYNLIFMLAAFLSSEGVKNYQKVYSYVEVALGIIQLVRIPILPIPAHSFTETVGEVTTQAMSDGKFTLCIVCLIGSSVCLICSAVINYIKCGQLAAHLKSIEGQKA